METQFRAAHTRFAALTTLKDRVELKIAKANQDLCSVLVEYQNEYRENAASKPSEENPIKENANENELDGIPCIGPVRRYVISTKTLPGR